MDTTVLAITFAVVFGMSTAATAVLLPVLGRLRSLDRPNERSSHETPTPKGAGLAVMGVLLSAWAVFLWLAPKPDGGALLVLAAALALAGISWLDDLRGLSPVPRLTAQAAAVAVGIWALAGEAPVFQGLLSPWLDRIATGLVWLWFINLFNFMDGIDGMAGGEAASLGLGLFLLASFAALDPAVGDPALLATAACLGFLVWNWHPARIFLGDVGSVPLGFLFGWLLLGAAARGYWAPALILPLYYLADSTLTLLRRLARGELVWRAHREHFYQRAVQRGLSHADVVLAVLAGNAALIALALAAALGWTVPALIAAAFVVTGLLWHLGRKAKS